MPANETAITIAAAIRAKTNSSVVQIPDADMEDILNAAVERISHVHDWTPAEQTYPFTYGAATDGYPLPAGFVKEELVALVVSGASVKPSSARQPLVQYPGGRQAWVSQFPVTDTERRQTNFPQSVTDTTDAALFQYYFWAGKIYVVPNPDGDKALEMDYTGRFAPFNLVAGTLIENGLTQEFPHLLTAAALVEAWVYLHEEQRAGIVDSHFTARLLPGAIKADAQKRTSGHPRHRGT